MTPSPFTTYADTVCQSLKNATRRECKAIRQELEDHLTDHAEALIESGWDEAHATQHALDAMGDPNTVPADAGGVSALLSAAGDGGPPGRRAALGLSPGRRPTPGLLGRLRSSPRLAPPGRPRAGPAGGRHPALLRRGDPAQ